MLKITVLLFLTLPLFAVSQIKIICDKNGEEVYLNGKFKSECSQGEPVSLLVNSGRHKIEVRKKDKNGRYEFVKVIRVGDGVSKVVEAKATPIYSEYYYFDQARKNESLDDCKNYLHKYPQGKYVKGIKELELYIKAKNDFNLFKEYFKKYPNGAYKEKLINYYKENPLVATLQGHRDWAYGLAVSKDGKTLYSVGTNDGTIKVWNLENFTLKREYHVNDRNGLDYIALSPSQNEAITGNSSVRIWNLKNGGYKDLKINFYGAKGNFIDAQHFVGVDGTSFKIADIPKQKIDYTFSPNDGYDANLNTSVITKDKRYAYFSYYDPKSEKYVIAKFDLAKKKIIKVFGSYALKDEIHALAITNDGKYLISGMSDCSNSTVYNTTDNTVIIWDTATYKPVKILKQKDGVQAVALDRKNRLLAITGWSGEIKIWDFKTKTLLHTINTYTPIFDLKFSNDGTLLTAALKNGTVKVFYTGAYRLKESLHTLMQTCKQGDIATCAAILRYNGSKKAKDIILHKVEDLTHKRFSNPKIYLLKESALSIYENRNGGLKTQLNLLIKDGNKIYAPVLMHFKNASFTFNAPIALIQGDNRIVCTKRYPNDYKIGYATNKKKADVVFEFDNIMLKKGKIRIYENPEKTECTTCLRLDGFTQKLF